MLWFYERDTIALRLETRHDSKTAEYVAVLHHPDGRQESRRFSKLEAFRQWLVALEQTLAAGRWTRKGSPDILPDWISGVVPAPVSVTLSLTQRPASRPASPASARAFHVRIVNSPPCDMA